MKAAGAIFNKNTGGQGVEDCKLPLVGHKEFRGGAVLEIVDDFDGDTYRAVYTVRLAGVVYVLHAFQKKPKSGIETPQSEIDIIKTRLARAKRHYDKHYAAG